MHTVYSECRRMKLSTKSCCSVKMEDTPYTLYFIKSSTFSRDFYPFFVKNTYTIYLGHLLHCISLNFVKHPFTLC